MSDSSKASSQDRLNMRHGIDCIKVEHENRSCYMHEPDDDTPYDVDGVSYCGRCHRVMPHTECDECEGRGIVNQQEADSGMVITEWVPCRECGGTGVLPSAPGGREGCR